MKKFIKASLLTLGLGVIILSAYQIQHVRNDHDEKRIIKKLINKYEAYQIKGSWIQRQKNHYIGEITVSIDHQWRRIRFRTDVNGKLLTY